MKNSHTILIATTNPGKFIEIKALFSTYAHLQFRLITPDEAGIFLDVKEDGLTYPENAAKKALAYAQASGMMTLADDSGLEVEALNGRPGLFSARYTGQTGNEPRSEPVPVKRLSDAERRAVLLYELGACPRPWKARFFCAAAAALSDGGIYHTDGACSGEIVPIERGTNGFGYDPIFQIGEPDLSDLTMAELSLEQKNRISHRAVAVSQMILLLEKALEQPGLP